MIHAVNIKCALIGSCTLNRLDMVYTYKVETCPGTGITRPRSAVSNVSDCRSRGREFDPGLILSWRLIMK